MSLPKTPEDVLLDDLAGKPWWTIAGYEELTDQQRSERRDDMYQMLTGWTAQDFGYDVEAWRTWMLDHPNWTRDPANEKRFEEMIARREAQRIASERKQE